MLPSTYYIGSIGSGGNFRDWVVDAYASYGRQDYGLVETGIGTRESQLDGSDYFAIGARGGRIFRPAPRWYATPTIGVQYVATHSLRHGFDRGPALDFEVRERALTGNASLRIDRGLGNEEQHFLGLSLAHYISSNGLTRLDVAPPTSGMASTRTPDSWEELGTWATVRAARHLFLDLEAQQTFGAVAGDSSTITLGARWRF